MNFDSPLPKRGEIWRVNFNPTIETEIKKTRPAIVISSDAVGKLPIKLVAPITDWKDYFSNDLWLVKVIPNNFNGLSKISTIDTLQLRGIDTQRFIEKIGAIDAVTMEEILLAIAVVIEFSNF